MCYGDIFDMGPWVGASAKISQWHITAPDLDNLEIVRPPKAPSGLEMA